LRAIEQQAIESCGFSAIAPLHFSKHRHDNKHAHALSIVARGPKASHHPLPSFPFFSLVSHCTHDATGIQPRFAFRVEGRHSQGKREQASAMSRDGHNRVSLQVESTPLLAAKTAAHGAGTASVSDVVAYICKVERQLQ
jgi:hypothetical protein